MGVGERGERCIWTAAEAIERYEQPTPIIGEDHVGNKDLGLFFRVGKWEGGKRAKRGGNTWGSDRKKGAEGDSDFRRKKRGTTEGGRKHNI